MTAKEKAEELIKKYSPLVTTWDCYWDSPREDKYILEDAKQCALITVDEILLEIDDTTLSEAQTEYWLEVKTEIENL